MRNAKENEYFRGLGLVLRVLNTFVNESILKRVYREGLKESGVGESTFYNLFLA